MVAVFVHALHIRFVVLVPVLQSLVSILEQPFELSFLRLLQSGYGTQFIKNLMLLLEPKRSKEVFEVIEIQQTLPPAIDHSQQAAHLFLRYLSTEFGDVVQDIFASDGVLVGADRFEDLGGVEVEGT